MHDALLISGFLTSSEIETFGAQAVTWMQELVGQRRAGLLTRSRGVHLWIAAERLPLFRQVFPEGTCNPQLRVPEAELRTSWERPDAVRELVRGRMEISGPVTESSLLDLFRVSSSELKTALLALEGEGFVLRGHFRSAGGELEWCDRRLLARIHRLTLNRLRSEIQPVSLAEFQRFLVIWQRVAPEHRAEGPEGLRMVLETLDGYEIAAAAWEPDILASRVKDYSPQWLDQLCYTGQFGWGRLRHPRSQNSHPTSPIRSTPISLFLREHLADWLALSPFEQTTQLGPDVALVLERFQRQGALFFGELLKQRSLLPSRVEEALAELAAQGCVTSDSFEGLRALLLPRDKRIPFINSERRRRHKAVSSVEYAGRWSLLRGSGPWTGDIAHRNIDLGSRTVNSKGISNGRVQPELPQTGLESGTVHPKREESVEVFARVLLRRYGIVFRTLIQRESIGVSWYELGRVFRRLEARGHIRGGYFVGGVGGEQFALPEAVGRLRSTRGTAPEGQLVVISGADPLNLAGILSPGKRIPAIASNRVLLRDGVPAAALEGRQVLSFESEAKELDGMLARKLRVGALPVSLRPYYG